MHAHVRTSSQVWPLTPPSFRAQRVPACNFDLPRPYHPAPALHCQAARTMASGGGRYCPLPLIGRSSYAVPRTGAWVKAGEESTPAHRTCGGLCGCLCACVCACACECMLACAPPASALVVGGPACRGVPVEGGCPFLQSMLRRTHSGWLPTPTGWLPIPAINVEAHPQRVAAHSHRGWLPTHSCSVAAHRVAGLTPAAGRHSSTPTPTAQEHRHT